MPCYHPLTAGRLSDGSISFTYKSVRDVIPIKLPCGLCSGCRLERSRQWATRIMHERSLHESACFVTLTYDEESLPEGNSLDYPAVQKFMKRLRKRTGSPVRFYLCGEYGDEKGRPHYHICLFGFDFPDKVYYRRTKSGERIYVSRLLESLWPFGLSSIGDLTWQSAAYVARYCMKKVNGDLAEAHYEYIDSDGVVHNRVPEFAHMSLKPGIGAGWLEKFRSDVFPRDYVVVNGVKSRPPRYYDKLNKRHSPAVFQDVKDEREYRGYLEMLKGEFSEHRLLVKEQVKAAQLRNLKRSI